MPSKIAERIDGMGKRIGKVLPSMQGGFLTNKWILYLVLFSAIFDLFYFYQKGDMYALTIFFIIGFLVSFFSKNMVVILILAIALTHLIRYGKNLSEGFKDGDDDDEEEGKKSETFEDPDATESPEGFEGEDDDEEVKKSETFEDPTEEPETFKSADKIAETANVVNGFSSSNVDARAQTLIDTQQKLMKSMETLKPMLDKAEGFLNTVGSKKEKFTNLADAYGPLKR